MLPFLLGLIGYVVVWLFIRWLKTRLPVVVGNLEEWALPTVVVILFVGILLL